MGLKICVIGCGWAADAMHGPAYLKYKAENPGILFAGCCDTDVARAEAFREKFGFERSYTDSHAMIFEQKPDAVSLLTPPEYTAQLAAPILEAGIPLLLEKPPGMTLNDVLRLAEIARRKNTPHKVAFNRRHAPLIRKLKELLEDEPEPIRNLRYSMLRVSRLDADFSTTAIHAIDTARFLAGADYEDVRFAYAGYPGLEKNVVDMRMECAMANGSHVTVDICPAVGVNAEGAEINIRNKTFFLDFISNAINPDGRLTVFKDGQVVFDMTGSADGSERFEREGFYWENKTFFDDVSAGRVPSCDLSSAVQSVMLAECIRNRADNNKANRA